MLQFPVATEAFRDSGTPGGFTAKRPREGAVPDAPNVLLPVPGTVTAMAPVTAMTPAATPAARTPAAMAPIAAMPPAVTATAMPAAAPTAAVVDLHGIPGHLVLNPRHGGRNRCSLRGHANQCTGSDCNREQILPHEQILLIVAPFPRPMRYMGVNRDFQRLMQPVTFSFSIPPRAA
jgi:hypothetical protein